MRQRTIAYKTYVKRTLVEAFRAVFVNHPDKIIATTKVDVDFPMDRNDYPALVVRFYERSLQSAGVGHEEWFDISEEEDVFKLQRFEHYLYEGDIEFAIYGLSSPDRDYVADAVVEVLAFGQLDPYEDVFFQRVYPDADDIPAARTHFTNLNTDKIQPYGETQSVAPWMPEDVLVYQTSYRVPIFGEFYSRIRRIPGARFIESVDIYPWIPSVGEEEPNPNPEDNSLWIPYGN